MDLLDEIIQKEKESISKAVSEEDVTKEAVQKVLDNNNALKVFTVQEYQNFLTTLKEELQNIKDRYESAPNKGDRRESKLLESDISQLEESLTLLNNKLLILRDSRKKDVEETLQPNELENQEKLEELILEYLKMKKLIEEEINALKLTSTTSQPSSENSSLKLELEKNILEKKLKARTGIEEVLLLLYSEIEQLKERVNHEIKSRVELEMLVEVEVNELNRRLLYESNAREEVKLQFDQLLRIKNSIAGDLKLICAKLQLILDRDSNYHPILNSKASSDGENNDKNIVSNYVEEELLDIVSMAQDLEGQLSTISELVDPSELEIFTQPNYHIKMIEKLNQQSARNISSRKNLEEKNAILEQNITKLERLLDDQKNSRLSLEKKFESQIAELKKSLKA